VLVAPAVAVAAKDVAGPVAAAPEICFPGAAIRPGPGKESREEHDGKDDGLHFYLKKSGKSYSKAYESNCDITKSAR